VLVLTFDEPIDASSFDQTHVTFSNNDISNAARYTLQFSPLQVVRVNSTVLIVDLDLEDANELRGQHNLATQLADTFIEIGSQAITDTSGNRVVALSSANALQAQAVEQDVEPPSMQSFNVDFDTGEIVLVFDESVNASSVSLDLMSLWSGQALASPVVITSSSSVTPISLTSIQVTLSEQDLNQLKKEQVCTTQQRCYILLEQTFIRDFEGLGSHAVTQNASHIVSSFIEDTTAPQLDFLGFQSIDFTLQTIQLSFSEVVNISSLVGSQLVLQSSHTPASAATGYDSLTLTLVPTNTTPDSIVVLQLSESDVQALTAKPSLCTIQTNCYISFAASFLTDMSGNGVESIPIGFSGRQA
jgi:hypothetical protein